MRRPKKPTAGSLRFTVKRPNDEAMEVALDGKHIISVNHDEHGWAGMELVRTTIKEISRVLNIPVVDEESVP